MREARKRRVSTVTVPPRKRKRRSWPVEVRGAIHKDGIDEIVARDCTIHIEQMSADSWYMGIDASDGSHWQFWFGAKNRRSAVEFRHVEFIPKAER